jgi:SAM-dependent methyltransferase
MPSEHPRRIRRAPGSDTTRSRARESARRHARGPAQGRYGNPRDLDGMIKRQLDPGRGAWQKPAEVVRRLGIRRGEVVAEIGCGPGYFTGRLARAVGPSGRVFAVDAEPMILETLRDRLDGIRNVTPVLGRGDDPLLQRGSCDLTLVVNVYHHFGERATALRRIARTLNSRGRLVNIDWDARETPVGPPLTRRIPRDHFLRDARRAGLTLVAEHQCLPYQYFLVLRPTR